MRRYFLWPAAAAILLGSGGVPTVLRAESRPALTRKTVKAAIENAKTAQDHQRIAVYYRGEAERMLAEAKAAA